MGLDCLRNKTGLLGPSGHVGLLLQVGYGGRAGLSVGSRWMRSGWGEEGGAEASGWWRGGQVLLVGVEVLRG